MANQPMMRPQKPGNPMTDSDPFFLPGVPAKVVRAIYEKAAGNEIGSGKFANPASSAALAANGFGWFLDCPGGLPPFPPLGDLDWPAKSISIEREVRFPWSGGRHPWLDAVVETDAHVIGVESKRFEPFRDGKRAFFAEAYDRDVWGEGMEPWCAMRDELRHAPAMFRHLDAAQLVKHALGLATEAERTGKRPVLIYLFAEPLAHSLAHQRHRDEITSFMAAAAGARVRFATCSWREWLATFEGKDATHAGRVIERFDP